MHLKSFLSIFSIFSIFSIGLAIFIIISYVSTVYGASSYKSELSYKIQYMIGNRQAKELDQFLKSVNYEKLSPMEKGDIIVAYTELYSWGGAGYNYSEKAYKLAEELIKHFPNLWKGYYCMAVVLAHRIQKNNLLAITLTQKLDYNLNMAVKFGKDEWLPHYLAAVRYIEVPILPDLKKGEELLKRAIELEPNHVYAYVIYGKLYEKKGLLCEAARMYRRALEMPVRAEWKIVDEEAKSIAKQRILEVEIECTKR